MKEWVKNLQQAVVVQGHQARIHSQSIQDGVLEEIFKNIGSSHSDRKPFCVEFGFNHPELVGGSGSNVANLVLNKGWDYLLLDGDFENPEINLHKHYLTSENICDIFEQYNVPKDAEYISVDVDSCDLWLFKALVKEYRAKVYTVEYNGNYPIDAAITFPDDPTEHWEGDRGYGASLKALTMVAQENGYSLVYVVGSLDAFFVRNDLLDDGELRSWPLEAWASMTNNTQHFPMRRPERIAMFIDYEEYCKTGGDLEKSRAKAQQICQYYLVDKPCTRGWNKPDPGKEEAKKNPWKPSWETK